MIELNAQRAAASHTDKYTAQGSRTYASACAYGLLSETGRDPFCLAPRLGRAEGTEGGVAVRVQADYSRSGRLLRYSMVLIDTHNTAADNGRVLGYDNSHGYHHRHYLGKVEPVEFESYESTETRFEAEVRQYLKTEEPKPRT